MQEKILQPVCLADNKGLIAPFSSGRTGFSSRLLLHSQRNRRCACPAGAGPRPAPRRISRGGRSSCRGNNGDLVVTQSTSCAAAHGAGQGVRLEPGTGLSKPCAAILLLRPGWNPAVSPTPKPSVWGQSRCRGSRISLSRVAPSRSKSGHRHRTGRVGSRPLSAGYTNSA